MDKPVGKIEEKNERWTITTELYLYIQYSHMG